MSVYHRVCSAPVGSLPSDCVESQDAVLARTGRNSEYYQKSRSPLIEKLTLVPQTSRRLFLKKAEQNFVKSVTARYVFLLRAGVSLIVLISVFQNPLCVADI